MAKLNAAHMSILCVLLGASYFARDCTACGKHKPGTSRAEEAADCSQEEESEADSDEEQPDATSNTVLPGTEELEKDLQSTVKFKETDDEVSTPTSDSALPGNEQPEEDMQSTVKLKDTDDEVPATVQPVVHHLSVRGAIPVLKETENLYKEALRMAASRAYLHDTDGEAVELVRSLVRLIFAVKAIRTYIENVHSAWKHLEETVQHLAEHEEHPPEGKTGGDALLRF